MGIPGSGRIFSGPVAVGRSPGRIFGPACLGGDFGSQGGYGGGDESLRDRMKRQDYDSVILPLSE